MTGRLMQPGLRWPDPSQRPCHCRAPCAAPVVSADMCAVELAAGLQAGPASLLADAADVFGDEASGRIPLRVLGQALTWHARVASFKGLTMAVFGVFMLGCTVWSVAVGDVPQPITMGTIGALALLVNGGGGVVMRHAWRESDANTHSAWLRCRNDAIDDLAAMGVALGVLGTGSGWPAFVTAAVMGMLALTAAVCSVIGQARAELRPMPACV